MSSRWLDPIPTYITDLPIGLNPWPILQTVRYRTDVLPNRPVIEITPFDSDLASIPRFLWRIYPPGGWYRKACVLHDWVCYLGRSGSPICTPAEASLLLAEAMTDSPYSDEVTVWCFQYATWAFGPKFGGPRG